MTIGEKKSVLLKYSTICTGKNWKSAAACVPEQSQIVRHFQVVASQSKFKHDKKAVACLPTPLNSYNIRDRDRDRIGGGTG